MLRRRFAMSLPSSNADGRLVGCMFSNGFSSFFLMHASNCSSLSTTINSNFSSTDAQTTSIVDSTRACCKGVLDTVSKSWKGSIVLFEADRARQPTADNGSSNREVDRWRVSTVKHVESETQTSAGKSCLKRKYAHRVLSLTQAVRALSMPSAAVKVFLYGVIYMSHVVELEIDDDSGPDMRSRVGTEEYTIHITEDLARTSGREERKMPVELKDLTRRKDGRIQWKNPETQQLVTIPPGPLKVRLEKALKNRGIQKALRTFAVNVGAGNATTIGGMVGVGVHIDRPRSITTSEEAQLRQQIQHMRQIERMHKLAGGVERVNKDYRGRDARVTRGGAIEKVDIPKQLATLARFREIKKSRQKPQWHKTEESMVINNVLKKGVEDATEDEAETIKEMEATYRRRQREWRKIDEKVSYKYAGSSSDNINSEHEFGVWQRTFLRQGVEPFYQFHRFFVLSGRLAAFETYVSPGHFYAGTREKPVDAHGAWRAGFGEFKKGTVVQRRYEDYGGQLVSVDWYREKVGDGWHEAKDLPSSITMKTTQVCVIPPDAPLTADMSKPGLRLKKGYVVNAGIMLKRTGLNAGQRDLQTMAEIAKGVFKPLKDLKPQSAMMTYVEMNTTHTERVINNLITRRSR